MSEISTIFSKILAQSDSGQRSESLSLSLMQISSYLKHDPSPSPPIEKIITKYLSSATGLEKFAAKYLKAFNRIDYPMPTQTTPDEIVSLILHHEFGVKPNQLQAVQLNHQRCMSIENCIGNLLERYIDNALHNYNWHWCCGSVVPSVDFLHQDQNGEWYALQIKNRSNSENSSSSKVRSGTNIQYWYRSDAYSNRTYWNNVPKAMQSLGLSEDGFREFVLDYLKQNRPSK